MIARVRLLYCVHVASSHQPLLGRVYLRPGMDLQVPDAHSADILMGMARVSKQNT